MSKLDFKRKTVLERYRYSTEYGDGRAPVIITFSDGVFSGIETVVEKPESKEDMELFSKINEEVGRLISEIRSDPEVPNSSTKGVSAMRPVHAEVDGQKMEGLFHKWVERKTLKPPPGNVMEAGWTGMEWVKETVGIVEKMDGTILYVLPHKIKFLDQTDD